MSFDPKIIGRSVGSREEGIEISGRIVGSWEEGIEISGRIVVSREERKEIEPAYTHDSEQGGAREKLLQISGWNQRKWF